MKFCSVCSLLISSCTNDKNFHVYNGVHYLSLVRPRKNCLQDPNVIQLGVDIFTPRSVHKNKISKSLAKIRTHRNNLESMTPKNSQLLFVDARNRHILQLFKFQKFNVI